MLLSPYAIGLDIQEEELHIVLLKKTHGGFELKALNSRKLENSIFKEDHIRNPEELTALIRALLKEAVPHEIKSSLPTFCTVPESKIFLHLFTLPASLKKPEEILSALIFEAEKVIPFPMNEVYCDYQSIMNDGQNQKLLFAAIQKTIADELEQVLTATDLKTRFFGLKNNAVSQALIGDEEKNRNLLLADIDDTTVTLASLSSQKIINCNFIHLASGAENSEKNYQKIAAIINESLSKPLNAKGEKIDEVIASGSALTDSRLFSFLKKNLTPKISLGNPWKNIRINEEVIETISQKKDIGNEKALSFSTAIGLAISGLTKKTAANHKINLIPEKVKQKDFYQKIILSTNFVSIMSIFLASLMVFFYLRAYLNIYFQHELLKGAQGSIQNLQNGTRYSEIKNQIIDFNKEINLLKTLEGKTHLTSRILKDFLTSIPKNISITRINYDNHNRLISLEGIAEKREDILTAKNQIKNFPLQLKIESPLSNLDAKENISFTIKVTLDEKKLNDYTLAHASAD